MEFVTNLLVAAAPYYDFISSLIGSFAILAAMTSNTADNTIVNIALKLINLLGANFGKAKNSD